HRASRPHRGLGEPGRAAGADELRARAGRGPAARGARGRRRARARRRSAPARRRARAPAGHAAAWPRRRRHARGAERAARRSGDHAADARRSGARRHRRGQARRARARLAGVPAAMTLLTRRALLRAGACALAAVAAPPRFLARAAEAAEARGKILVAGFQRGAVDGLSMVAPHGDRAYYAARANIALGRPQRGDSATALDLDGFFALHPALAPLLPLWNARALAVVHACGSPDTTRSHFDAQDYMESGTPGVKSTADGWLGRASGALPSEGVTPFRAVALGTRLPRILAGPSPALAVSSLERFEVKTAGAPAATAHGFESLYGDGVRDLLHGTG